MELLCYTRKPLEDILYANRVPRALGTAGSRSMFPSQLWRNSSAMPAQAP